MITSQAFRTAMSMPIPPSRPKNSPELSRVFAAAVINQQFRDMLLRNPNEALQHGYQGMAFLLSKEETDALVSIRAESLSDLAKHVSKVFGN